MADIEKESGLGDAGRSSLTGLSSVSSDEIKAEDGAERPARLAAIRSKSKQSQGSRSQSRRSDRSQAAASDNSDPLSALELALSHGSQGFQFPEATRIRTATSFGSSASRPPDYEVVFEDDDPENPRNWSLLYRSWMIFAISYTTWVVVFYSTSYTASVPGLMEAFNVTSEPVATLGVTTYLLGLATGSLLVAPASELWGRKPVYIVCMTCFTLLVIPCCLATSLTEMIIVRYFG